MLKCADDTKVFGKTESGSIYMMLLIVCSNGLRTGKCCSILVNLIAFTQDV